VFEQANDEDQVFYDSVDPKFSSSQSSVGDSQIVVEEEATLEETAKDLPTAVSPSLSNSYSMVKPTAKLPATDECPDTLQELKQASTWPIKPRKENASAIDSLRASMKRAKKKRRSTLSSSQRPLPAPKVSNQTRAREEAQGGGATPLAREDAPLALPS
jgi:hypothetical protein